MAEIGYTGSMDRGTDASDYATVDFIIRRVLGRAATNSLVRVVSVAPGATGAVGTVDVQPMINQIDGANKAMPHGTIHNVPYLRLQGGVNAVILDPAVGDIGIAVFAAEDISSAKKTRAPANPGSRRRFSMSDALYLGGVLNGAPTQFVRVAGTGIDLTAPDARTSENLHVGNGATGSFTTPTGQIVTVTDGIVTNIY